MVFRLCVLLVIYFVTVVQCKSHSVYQKSFCPPPPIVPHAFVDSKLHQTNSGLKLYFKCAHGYEMTGDNRVYCLKVTSSHYVWSLPAFTCHPTSCPEPQGPKNGHVVGSDYEIGKKISFECKTAFTMFSADGSTKLEVSPQQICHVVSGKWVGAKPICVEEGKVDVEIKARAMAKMAGGGNCPLPPDVEHGYIDEDEWREGFSDGMVVNFKCASGFEMIGNGSVQCFKMDDGRIEWSEPKFTCEQSYCKPPSDPVGGRVIGSDFGLGKSVTYECFEPFLMYSADDKVQLQESPRQTCAENGEWIGETPLCHVFMCPDIQPILNGYVEAISRLPGGKVIFKCHNGFIRIGDHERICSSSGDWTGKTPRCSNAKTLVELYDEYLDENTLKDVDKNKTDEKPTMSFQDYIIKMWDSFKEIVNSGIQKINEQWDYSVGGGESSKSSNLI